jgi:hypothetical protein
MYYNKKGGEKHIFSPPFSLPFGLHPQGCRPKEFAFGDYMHPIANSDSTLYLPRLYGCAECCVHNSKCFAMHVSMVAYSLSF